MPELMKHSPGGQDLDGRVASLLKEMHEASERIMRQLATEEPPEPPAPVSEPARPGEDHAALPDETATAELAAQVESLLAGTPEATIAAEEVEPSPEVTQPEGSTEPVPASESGVVTEQADIPSEPVATAAESLSAEVAVPDAVDSVGTTEPEAEPQDEPVVSDVVEAPAERPSPPPVAAAEAQVGPSVSPTDIRSLDEELADVADSLIAGEITGGVEAADDIPPPPIPMPGVAAKTPVAAPPAAERPDPALDESEVSAKPVSAPAETRPSAPAVASSRPAPAAAPMVDPGSAGKGKVAALAGKAAHQAVAAAAPVVLKGMDAMNAPLRDQPPIVRSAIGWVAINTLFWAVVIWGYVLFFRQPEPPSKPPADPPASHGQPESGEKKPGGSAGEKKPAASSGGHGGH
jgi:hypothetical protein